MEIEIFKLVELFEYTFFYEFIFEVFTSSIANEINDIDAYVWELLWRPWKLTTSE